MSAYHYSENATANAFSFAKLICNKSVYNAIYVQSKDVGKYLQFQRNPKFNLYYMDISKAIVEDHCCFNTMKKGKSLFSILDQKRAEAVVLSHPTKTLSMH